MSARSQKIGETLTLIYDELVKGNRFFHIAKLLNKAEQDHRLISVRGFFWGAYEACLQESILSLAKLSISNKDSITIHYLLSLAEKNPRAFPYASPDQVTRTIIKHREKLESQSAFFATIKAKRDRVISHLDRKHINEPEVIFSSFVDMPKVGHCFTVFLKILKIYKKYYDGGDFSSFSTMERNIHEDIEYLTELLEKAQTEGMR